MSGAFQRCGVRYGRWWLLQWSFVGTLSLGIHVDPLRRVSGRGPYGPYVDLHLGPLALSFGYHPARSLNDSLMRPERW